MTPKSFLYEEQDGVATITLNRPHTLNSLTFEVYRELTDTFVKLKDRDGVRVVVLTGKGRAFCTGGDVNEIIGPLLYRTPDQLHEFTRMTCNLIHALRTLRRHIVASLNGTVAGAGAALALASDLRIAADTAKIGFLFVKVGLSGADMGAAQLLPRLVGAGRAAELLLTGDFIDAAEAYRIGLYNRVVPPDGLGEATAEMVGRLARGPLHGLAVTKEALTHEAAMTLEAALEYEARVQAELMSGADFREGFAAFTARRKPRFEGSPE